MGLRILRTTVCITLALTLTAMAPGYGFYEAAAAMMAGPAAVTGQLPGSAGAGAAGAGLNISVHPHGSALTPVSSLRTGSVIPSVSLRTPEVSPAARSLPAAAALPLRKTALRDGASIAPAAPSVSKTAALKAAERPETLFEAQAPVLKSLFSRMAPLTPFSRLAVSQDPGERKGAPAAPKGSPLPLGRSAEDFRIMFDGGRRRRSAFGAVPADDPSLPSVSGLKQDPGLSSEPAELTSSEVPAPASLPTEPVGASLLQSPWVRYGVPVSIGAAALALSWQLLPVAVLGAALLGSVLVHQTAHILGQRIWGDDASARAGRDSLNPLGSADLLGTLLIPALSMAVSAATIGVPVLLGWAKPVPVEFNNLGDVRKDSAKVALLGPAANLGLAALSGAALLLLPAAGTAALVLSTLFKVNLAMAAFNLIPLPWLDGGKLLTLLLPESAYRWWVRNPSVPEGYEGLYQKLYRGGPSNLLTAFDLRTRGQINGITQAASFAMFGALSALGLTELGLPLLFLALPCSYDYWCIREKVRSEKAVEDMMDIMSAWGGLMVQLAEDYDAESEVSAFEAEHALKNAVDQLLEDLMMDEDFRKLSDEDKRKEFMRRYPDMAVKWLKRKVFTEDTEDKIREILADKRNEAFLERIEGWLEEHDVFEKMASPHERKKLEDEMEEADKVRSAGDRDDD